MLICNYCGRNDFKKPQGLSGHIRMAHIGEELNIQEIPEAPEPRTEETIREMARQIANGVTEAIETTILRLKQETPHPLTAGEIQQAVHTELVQLGQALIADLSKEFNHHLCTDAACVICKPTVAGIRAQTIDKIEERLPGTIEGLQNYEALHTPIADLRFRTKL